MFPNQQVEYLEELQRRNTGEEVEEIDYDFEEEEVEEEELLDVEVVSPVMIRHDSNQLKLDITSARERVSTF